MPAAQQFIGEFEESGKLGAFQRSLGIDEGRMAAGAAQFADFRQDVDLALTGRAIEGGDILHRLKPHRLVKGAFLLRQLNRDGKLGARRQFAQHSVLGAAQNERPDHGSQSVAGGGLPVALDGTGEAALEALGCAEQARVDDVEQAPQLVEIILDGRAAQGDAKFRIELLAALARLVSAFLRFCASSSTTMFQARAVSLPSSCCSRP